MLNLVKSVEDINNFLDKTNSLHDGYVVGVKYINSGISKTERGHFFEPEKTKLVLQILVTSIWDAVVEIEFDGLFEWQIKDNQFSGIINTSVFFDKNRIVWLDDIYTDTEAMKKGSYVIAASMKWRIIE
jgi:hypothetical protein